LDSASKATTKRKARRLHTACCRFLEFASRKSYPNVMAVQSRQARECNKSSRSAARIGPAACLSCHFRAQFRLGRRRSSPRGSAEQANSRHGQPTAALVAVTIMQPSPFVDRSTIMVGHDATAFKGRIRPMPFSGCQVNEKCCAGSFSLRPAVAPKRARGTCRNEPVISTRSGAMCNRPMPLGLPAMWGP
jgi:hypothetical protein